MGLKEKKYIRREKIYNERDRIYFVIAFDVCKLRNVLCIFVRKIMHVREF